MAQAAERDVAAERFDARRMKFWEQSAIKETTWVLGDYLILVSTDQRPFYLIEIKNPLLCHTMREMFKLIWGGDTSSVKSAARADERTV